MQSLQHRCSLWSLQARGLRLPFLQLRKVDRQAPLPLTLKTRT